MTAFRPGFLDKLPPDPATPGTDVPLPAATPVDMRGAATPRSSPTEAEEQLSPHAPGFVETTSRPPPDDREDVWAPARIEAVPSRGSGALTWIAMGGALLIVSAVLLSAVASMLDHIVNQRPIGTRSQRANGTHT